MAPKGAPLQAIVEVVANAVAGSLPMYDAQHAGHGLADILAQGGIFCCVEGPEDLVHARLQGPVLNMFDDAQPNVLVADGFAPNPRRH